MTSFGLFRPPMVTFSYFKPASLYQNPLSILRNDSFDDGILLESKEKGVIYPIIHCAPFYGWNVPLEAESTPLGGKWHGGAEYVIEQGVYTELASVQADLFGASYDDLYAYRKSGGVSPTWNTFYLMLGFKQIPKTPFRDMMESEWKEWTGARYLYLNVPDEFGLVRLTLYKRREPATSAVAPRSAATDLNLFLYVLLAECVHVTTSRHRMFIKDFVQRMRADRMPPYVALYEDTSSSPVRRTRRRLSFGDGSSSTGSSSPLSATAASPLFGSPVPTFRSTFTLSVL